MIIGLNPYGLAYTLGLQDDAGTGLDGFLEIAAEIGARVVELHAPWLDGIDPAAVARRIDGLIPVVSCGLDPAGDEAEAGPVGLIEPAGQHLLRFGVEVIVTGIVAADGVAQACQLAQVGGGGVLDALRHHERCDRQFLLRA